MVDVDDLLGETEVRQSDHLAEEEDVALAELKEEAGLNTAGEKDVADEGPVLDWNILLLTLNQVTGQISLTTIRVSYLKYWTVDQIFLQESLGRHVVHDVGGQVLQDGVHGVPGLLPCDPQVFLQGPGY